MMLQELGRMMLQEELDRWLPPRGQCLVCGVPGMDARHRIMDVIRERASTGETPEEIASELEVPVEAVRIALIGLILAAPPGEPVHLDPDLAAWVTAEGRRRGVPPSAILTEVVAAYRKAVELDLDGEAS